MIMCTLVFEFFQHLRGQLHVTACYWHTSCLTPEKQWSRDLTERFRELKWRELLFLLSNFDGTPSIIIEPASLLSRCARNAHLKSARSLNFNNICGYKSSLIRSQVMSLRIRHSKQMNFAGILESSMEWYLYMYHICHTVSLETIKNDVPHTPEKRIREHVSRNVN